MYSFEILCDNTSVYKLHLIQPDANIWHIAQTYDLTSHCWWKVGNEQDYEEDQSIVMVNFFYELLCFSIKVTIYTSIQHRRGIYNSATFNKATV